MNRTKADNQALLKSMQHKIPVSRVDLIKKLHRARKQRNA